MTYSTMEALSHLPSFSFSLQRRKARSLFLCNLTRLTLTLATATVRPQTNLSPCKTLLACAVGAWWRKETSLATPSSLAARPTCYSKCIPALPPFPFLYSRKLPKSSFPLLLVTTRTECKAQPNDPLSPLKVGRRSSPLDGRKRFTKTFLENGKTS